MFMSAVGCKYRVPNRQVKVESKFQCYSTCLCVSLGIIAYPVWAKFIPIRP